MGFRDVGFGGMCGLRDSGLGIFGFRTVRIDCPASRFTVKGLGSKILERRVLGSGVCVVSC